MPTQTPSSPAEPRSFATALIDDLPATDPRIWAQTLQHLVAAGVRDGRCGHIADAHHEVVQPDAILAARQQIAALGARVGDVVVIKAVNDCAGATAMLAAWLNGCAVCPVDPSASPEVHELICEQANAAVVVETGGAMARRAEHAPPPGRIYALRATGVDLALMIFTSGSSGRPKGVMLSHSNVLSSLRAISTYLELGAQDKVLCVPPMFLDYGLYQVLFSLFTGCRLVLATGLTNPLKILALIRDTRPTVLPVVPALASGLTTVLNTFGQQIDSLRLVSNTGGHLAPSTVDAMRRSFPNAKIFAMYGLTETKRALFLPPHLLDVKAGSVGGPMPGLDARVVVAEVDGTLVEAQDGEVGELYLRGSSVMQGYHAEGSSAGARIVAGNYRDDVWLATGDLFERDAEGCLYFRGRTKSLIKQKGYCLYPRDLEAAAEAVPEIASAIAVGRSEDDGDESAILFAVLREQLDEERQEAVRLQVLERLHKSLQPRVIHFLPEWPALSVGKIDVPALRRMAEEV